MEYVIGALLLASFFGLAVYAVRGGNLMIGMLIIGTLWTVLPLFGNTFATNPDFIAAYPGVTDISFVAPSQRFTNPAPKAGAACWSTSCSARGLAAFCWKPASRTL